MHDGVAQWTKDRANPYKDARRYVAKVQWLAIARGEALCGMPTLHARTFLPAVTVEEPPIMRIRYLMRGVLACEPWECSPLAGELQRTVRATAAELRDLGNKPEQMVIALKRATSRGALRAATTREDDLHYRMILWSVREYFRCDS